MADVQAQNSYVGFTFHNGYVNGQQATSICPGDSYEAKTTVELSHRTSNTLTFEIWVKHDGQTVRHVLPTTLVPQSTSSLDLSVGAYTADANPHEIKVIAIVRDETGNLVGDGLNEIFFTPGECGPGSGGSGGPGSGPGGQQGG